MLAALSASLGNLALAEDCLQEAATKALTDWPKSGVPHVPAAWLIQVARRQAIDILRRSKRFQERSAELAQLKDEAMQKEPSELPDNRLALMFTCCHPALEPSAQVALTLHCIAGLTTAEIARAFVVQTSTMAARLTRAKAKIKNAGIPFGLPDEDARKARTSEVLRVIYLIYNEGYSASSGATPLRVDLCVEALFMAELLVHLSKGDPEAMGLLALIKFSYARREARAGDRNAYIPLDQQDRRLWDTQMIADGQAVLEQALSLGQVGPYQVQAAIHGLHSAALDASETDWSQIEHLYRLMRRMDGNPVIALNHAVAVGQAGDTERSLEMIADLEPVLAHYQPLYAAKAAMLARAGQISAADTAYLRAIKMSENAAEQDFLESRRALLSGIAH